MVSGIYVHRHLLGAERCARCAPHKGGAVTRSGACAKRVTKGAPVARERAHCVPKRAGAIVAAARCQRRASIGAARGVAQKEALRIVPFADANAPNNARAWSRLQTQNNGHRAQCWCSLCETKSCHLGIHLSQKMAFF